ncbi:MAG TPA: NHLP bacteriocin system secretion protein, partial [Longimicrobiaceae bacterium]|nr:NHLP bacteriocin system secretion protein [Longimicrobiaceae bacterium]
MSERRNIFREVALERLSSPEQLDQMMQVTTRKGWLALASLGGVLAAALVWGIFGSIPERVGGAGILVLSGGVYEVASESDGRVAEFAVQVGDTIREGEVVARLARPDLEERIRQARARVAELDARQRQLSHFGGRDAELQAAFLTQSRSSMQQSVAASEATLKALRDRVSNEEQLVAQGLLTRQALLATVQEYERVREKVRGDRSEVAQLEVRRLQAENSNREALQEARFRLDEARRELAQLESERRLTSELVSPYTGRVLEIMAERGSFVVRGQPVLNVDLERSGGHGLEAVVYVPSVHGKMVKPGMEIQIVPSTVRREEYGHLVGRVTYVSAFPATRKGMQRVLKNEQLVGALSGPDAPYEVHATLVPDVGSASRYRWSSSWGPPIELQSGTLAEGSIVVQRRRPVSMLIPQLRKQVAPGPGRTVAAAPRR